MGLIFLLMSFACFGVLVLGAAGLVAYLYTKKDNK